MAMCAPGRVRLTAALLAIAAALASPEMASGDQEIVMLSEAGELGSLLNTHADKSLFDPPWCLGTAHGN